MITALKTNRDLDFLFIAANPYGDGGSEVLWKKTAAHLIRQGNRVGILIPHDYPLGAELEGLSGKAQLLWRYKETATTLREKIQTRLSSNVLQKKLQTLKPKLVVISNNTHDGLQWAERARSCGLAFTMIFQAAREVCWPSDGQAERILQTYNEARRLYWVSIGNLRLFERQIGGALKNTELVRNPFTVPYDRPLPFVDNDIARFGVVARLEPGDKGQDLVLEALSDPSWKRRGFHCTFAGSGSARRSLEKLAKHFGIEENVTFTGHIQDIHGFWANKHALLLASRSEGLSLAIVEAMLCGRFAVATAVGDSADLIQDGKSGFIAPFPTTEAFASALERAVARRSEWAKIAAAARARAMQVVSADPVADFANKLTALAG